MVVYSFSCKQVSYQSPICEKNDCIFSSYILGLMDKKIFDLLGCVGLGNKKILKRISSIIINVEMVFDTNWTSIKKPGSWYLKHN